MIEIQIFKAITSGRFNTEVIGTIVISGNDYLIATLEDIHNDRDNNLVSIQKDTIEFIRTEKIQ